MRKNNYYILVTNDDGIFAEGIDTLVTELRKFWKVVVVAPESEKSAVGHAITLSDPLRVKNFSKNGRWEGFAVSGTPADCVKIGVCALLDKKPDMIVSGINLGSNTGINVIYSGTVSAATEGTIMGIPSIAISLGTYTNPNFKPAAQFAVKIVDKILKDRLPEGTLLNINVPNVKSIDEIKGVRITRQGTSGYAESFDKRVDPRNRTYYWMEGDKIIKEDDINIDDVALINNYISITPIHYDLTNYTVINHFKKWVETL
ncbi:MAG: 5'/3'-nucleotidase SurE [Candidatus Marinimicrobia bacterium]|nr:5'/3'-nucleotidase SurE [Candidatus Neomarinimicrobiota bacterium]